MNSYNKCWRNFFRWKSKLDYAFARAEMPAISHNRFNELSAMTWNDLTDEKQLAEIKDLSKEQPVVIFKHSTRCSISSMAKGRLERSMAPANTAFYYLDLIRYRNISNRIAEMFHVHHESPQVLLIRNGECVYDESHNGISMEEIVEQAAA